MKSQQILKVINPIMGVLFIMIIGSALFREHLHGEAYEYLHMMPGLLFGLLGIVHLFLNRNWIKGAYFSKNK